MTIIEFFDDNALLNAFSTLLLHPDRLILFGSNLQRMHAFARQMHSLLEMRNQKTDIQVVGIHADNHEEIAQRLQRIITLYPDCVFDVSGGDTPILVSMGALSARHGVPMHTVDPLHNTFSVISGTYPPVNFPVTLSVEEIITLFGGHVSSSFAPSLTNTSFFSDVTAAWSVCRRNSTLWNNAIGAMHTVFQNNDSLFSTVDTKEAKRKLSPQKYAQMKTLLTELSSANLLTGCRITHDTISFSYKNLSVSQLLSKAGTTLELYTYQTAQKFAPSLFQDAKTGVVIDWQPQAQANSFDSVTNEIDVFLTSGVLPVFISCKNGFTNSDELYKLSVVAKRFGGTYAKKMIVLTQFVPDDTFMERAKELGIFVIYNVHRMSSETFAEKLRTGLSKY